jgi:FKBP-type peptidyl-prolyl cis-trans isomerases 1
MIEAESRTPKGQRIAIFSIAVLMIVSTIALYAMVIIQDGNDRAEKTKQQDLEKQFSDKVDVRNAKADALRLELSGKYYDAFKGYKSKVKAYNANAVTELKTRDLKAGSGAKIDDDSEYAIYYIGWLPNETIFDSSLSDSSLAAPLSHQSDGTWVFSDGSTGGVIEGWVEGIPGMKMGGVREITIPSHKGYGETGAGESIPANSPLKFIVMVIPMPKTVPYPAGTLDLCGKVYTETYGDEETAMYYCQYYMNIIEE